MKNTACTFIQYLENNAIPGHKKVIGFTIENEINVLQFCKMPTITEWMAITEVWQNTFKMSLNNINLQFLR